MIRWPDIILAALHLSPSLSWLAIVLGLLVLYLLVFHQPGEAERSDAREAEGSGLLSRPASNRRVGSNPTPTASECVTIGKRGVVPAPSTSRDKQADDQAIRRGLAAPLSRKAAASPVHPLGAASTSQQNGLTADAAGRADLGGDAA